MNNVAAARKLLLAAKNAERASSEVLFQAYKALLAAQDANHSWEVLQPLHAAHLEATYNHGVAWHRLAMLRG